MTSITDCDVTTACCVVISPRKLVLPEDVPKELYAFCVHKLAGPGLELGLRLGQRVYGYELDYGYVTGLSCRVQTLPYRVMGKLQDS